MNNELINWLLEGPEWLQYKVKADLLSLSENNDELILCKDKILKDNIISGLIKELNEWPGAPLKNHKDSTHPINKLSFLVDIGLNIKDTGIETIAEKIILHKSSEGLFQSLIFIPEHFGGSGEGKWSWMLCDAPLLVYALVKFGLGGHSDIKNAVRYLASLVSDNGWRCIVSPELKFRGPGKKEDPCPYATLIMLKLLAQYEDLKNSTECKIGTECVLKLWENSREMHPYMFYMGTDFKKLKAPLLWYDVLHVLDILTLFPWLKEDKRLREMLEIVSSKADNEGKYTPESIYTKLNGWEFSQKKEPSRWITFLVYRILNRLKA